MITLNFLQDLSESDWPHHDVIKYHHAKLKNIDFPDIWWHLDGSTRKIIKCHQNSHSHVINCHEKLFNLTWWHFMTYDDLWWQNMLFIMICHEMARQIMKWFHLIQRGRTCALEIRYACGGPGGDLLSRLYSNTKIVFVGLERQSYRCNNNVLVCV